MSVKTKFYDLDCGAKLILSTDKKHLFNAKITVRFGSDYNKIVLDDKTIDIIPGTAHFIEHTVIEKTPFGNGLVYFEKDNSSSNASTGAEFTDFYVSGVNRKIESIIDLIRIVNEASFDDIEDLKGPIIEERKQKQNSFYYDFSVIKRKMTNCYFDGLGDIDDIKGFDKDYLKEIYNIIYNPSNQVINISGDFDCDELYKIVNDAYNKYDREQVNFKLVRFNKTVNYKKEDIVIESGNVDQAICLTYCMDYDVNKFKEYEVYYYLMFYSKCVTGPESVLFDRLRKENISNYNTDFDCNIIDGKVFLSYIVWTDECDKGKELLLQEITKYKRDKDEFDVSYRFEYASDYVIYSVHSINERLFSRYIKYGIESYDVCDLLKDISYDKYLELFDGFVFDNYSTITLKNKLNS